METTPKICVAGVGAVGGVLAGVLGRDYASSLTLIARGARLEALRQSGLALHSQFYGERVVIPAHVSADAAGMEKQDFIFVCVKNYSLDEIAEVLRPLADEHTVVVPVMNGVEAGDRLRQKLPESIVCDAVIYTNSAAGPDASVIQTGAYTFVHLGSKLRDERRLTGARRALDLLTGVGFDARWAEDIESELWQKFILNCAFNIITARYRNTSGDIRRDAALARDARALLTEAAEVAAAEGVALPADTVEQKYRFITQTQADTATSSMRRDVEAGRPTEKDAFTGAVIRKASLHGIPVPVTERYHRELEKTVS